MKDVHWLRSASRPWLGAVSLSGSFPGAATHLTPGLLSTVALTQPTTEPRARAWPAWGGAGLCGWGEGMACVRQGGALRGRGLRGVPATTFLRAPSVPTVQACWGDPHFALLTQRCLESVGLSTMRPLISACYFLVDDPRGRGATQTSRVDVPGRTPPSCWAHQRTLCRFPRGPARQA